MNSEVTVLDTPASQPRGGNTIRASWQFSLDDVRANISRYDPDDQQVLVNALLWCVDDRHPISKPELARRIGASDNLLYKIYTGKYWAEDGSPLGPSEKLISNIKTFLNEERQRYKAADRSFVMTPTATFIWNSCDLARESHSPVELWGAPQIGKTWALRAYRESHNHGRTVMVELDAISGVGGMVKALAAQLHISDKSNTADLVERIKRALTPDTVVIMDEVHLLKNTYQVGSYLKAVETLRRIQDKTECGMILSWTHYDDMTAFKDKELAQLWRRSVHRRNCGVMPSLKDLTEIFKTYSLDFPNKDLSFKIPGQELEEKPRAILRQLAKEDGLKAITERMRKARQLADSRRQRITWQHFVEVHLLIEKASKAEKEWN